MVMTDDGDDGCDVDGGECWSHIHSLFFSRAGALVTIRIRRDGVFTYIF